MPIIRLLIAYYRVSTKKQGRSGLGLEGQKAAVQQYARMVGATIVGEYTEVETGKRASRPELNKAVAHARRTRAILVVAKLDRLARNAAFLLTLRDSGVSLYFCDLPGANELTVGIMAVVAQEEARMISSRTKTALKAAKERGTQLGSSRQGHWEGREERRLEGARKGAKVAGERHTENARAAYVDILPLIRELREGGSTWREIAGRLSDMGHTTRRGCPWNGSQVMRVFNQVEG